MNKVIAGITKAAAVACCAVTLCSAALAQEKHDSNSLHKFGKALQYPFRKSSENLAVNVHRAEGKHSVVHRRNGNKTFRAVITANGQVHRKYRVGPHGRRARHRYNYYRKHH